MSTKQPQYGLSFKTEVNIHRHTTPPIDMNERSAENGISVGIAPHAIHAVGCLFMGINKYCVVKSRIVAQEPPARVQDHPIVIAEYWDVDEVRQKMWGLLKKMELKKTYKIEITGEHDLNGQVALLPILAATWESLYQFEFETVSQKHYGKLGKTTEFMIAMRSLKISDERHRVALSATMPGNWDMFSFEKDARKWHHIGLSSRTFHENFEFVFGTTNLHSSKFVPHLGWYRGEPDERKERVMCQVSNAENSFTSSMCTFSAQRLEGRYYLEPLQIERQCQEAFLTAGCFGGDSALRGYEVQQGGFLLVLKKDTFSSNLWMEQISSALSRHITCGKLDRIEFHLLKQGTHCQTIPLGAELQENHHAVVNLIQRPIPVSTEIMELPWNAITRIIVHLPLVVLIQMALECPTFYRLMHLAKIRLDCFKWRIHRFCYIKIQRGDEAVKIHARNDHLTKRWRNSRQLRLNRIFFDQKISYGGCAHLEFDTSERGADIATNMEILECLTYYIDPLFNVENYDFNFKPTFNDVKLVDCSFIFRVTKQFRSLKFLKQQEGIRGARCMEDYKFLQDQLTVENLRMQFPQINRRFIHSDDLNRILQEWIAGSMPQTKTISVDIHGAYAIVWTRVLRNIPFKNTMASPSVEYVGDGLEEIWFRKAKDIFRATDRRRGTVMFENHKFRFYAQGTDPS